MELTEDHIGENEEQAKAYPNDEGDHESLSVRDVFIPEIGKAKSLCELQSKQTQAPVENEHKSGIYKGKHGL